ncbi:MAG: S41 family peptidase [Bacteroidales bacterium]
MNKNTLIFLLLWLTFGSVTTFAQKENKDFEILKNLEIFSSVYKELHLNYVDEVKSGELIKTALDAMLRTLDPYTVYIPEAEIEDFKILTLGQYGGIGSTIHYRNGAVYISEPYKDFPAHKAGLLPGDKILKINGQDTKGKSTEDVSSLLKGQAGTSLELTIERIGVNKPLSFSMLRQEIKIDNVTFAGILKDQIAYIRLDGFTQDASKEFKDAFLKLKAEGIKGLIVDLRYNGGGLLNEAVNMVNMFVGKGLPVVSTKGKVEAKNHTFYTSDAPLDLDIPIVFLTSRGTASASEIFAGAMQDYDRAVIIGQRSFGKGLVQNVLPLDYNSQMKITVSKYYIPSGRCVQAIDYGHRDAEGKANKIPDSLRTAFKTKGGRSVYDGDGIEPEIELAEESYSNISASLLTKFLIFDFANEFKRNTPQIANPKDFIITDTLYANFITFLNDKEYGYETQSETLLKEMQRIAQEENYQENIQKELDALSLKLKDSKKEDLSKHKEEIRQLLKEEITSRYFFQKGRAEASLDGDKTVNKAIEVLTHPKEYQKLLSNTGR